MVARVRLTPRERTKVAYDQAYRCAACAALLSPDWHLDHIVPLADGGTNERPNLQAMCVACHADKTARESRRARPRRRHGRAAMLTRLIRFVQAMLACPEVRARIRHAGAPAPPPPPRTA
jgi:hypothetical protein